MPVEMEWEPRGVRSRFHGTVTAADLLQHVTEVCRHPDFDALRFSILDFRDATDAVDDDELLAVQANLTGAQFTNPRILVAALTSNPGTIAHLTRFIRRGVLNRQIQVFLTPEAAMAWIEEQSAFRMQ